MFHCIIKPLSTVKHSLSVKSHSSNSKKRKKKQQAGSDEDDMSDSSHDSEFSDLNIENLSSSGLSSSEEEDDLEDEDDEEINPFGDSDSDDGEIMYTVLMILGGIFPYVVCTLQPVIK